MIAKAFSTLVQEGSLIRISRGVYVAPVHGRFGTRPPSTESVIKGIDARRRETIVTSGAMDANALGLCTQNPIQEVFLTSGRSRTLHLGKRQVELTHGYC